MLKFINILVLLVLTCGFLFCIYQNIPNRASDIGTPRKVYALKDIWKDKAYGEMSEYSVFLAKNLFDKDCPGCLIRQPWPFSPDFKFYQEGFYSKEYDSNYYFLGGYIGWFLFPLKMERTNSYNYYLDEEQFKTLISYPSISVDSQFIGSAVKKRFYLLTQFDSSDYKEWSIYLYPQKDVLHVFTLPLGWLKDKKG